MVVATQTVKKGVPTHQGENQCVGITRWKCVPDQIANFPMYALGAEWPTRVTNATTKGKNSQSQNGGPIQNGVQIQNGTHNGGPIRNDKLGLPLQQPLSMTNPLSATNSPPYHA
jgi:hypothetical protein